MKTSAQTFIKEPGKTKLAAFRAEGGADLLKKLEPAEILGFRVKGDKVQLLNSKKEPLGTPIEEELNQRLVTLLKDQKEKLTPILLGRRQKVLEVLITAEEKLFPEDLERLEYRPFSRYIDEETPEVDLKETGSDEEEEDEEEPSTDEVVRPHG